MECHDYEKRIPEFISDNMPDKEKANFEKHLELCQACSKETKDFLQLEKMISAAAIKVSPINISAHVLGKVRSSRHKVSGLVTDLVAAWAVAIILFWFSSPLLIDSGLPHYTEGMSRTSTKITTSFNEAYKTYIDYSFEAVGKVSKEFKKIGSEIMKGDEGYEMREPSRK